MPRSSFLGLLMVSLLVLSGPAAAKEDDRVQAMTAYLSAGCATGASGTNATANGTGNGTGGDASGGCLSPSTLRVPANATALRLTFVNNGTTALTVDVCRPVTSSGATNTTDGNATGASAVAACRTNATAPQGANGTTPTNGTAGVAQACDDASATGTPGGMNASTDLTRLPATVPGGGSATVCVPLAAGASLRIVLADTGRAIGNVTMLAASITPATSTPTGSPTTGGVNGTNDTEGNGSQESTGGKGAPAPGVALLVAAAVGGAIALARWRRRG